MCSSDLSDFDGELVNSSDDECGAIVTKATTGWRRRRVQREAAKKHAENSTFEFPLSSEGLVPILSGSREVPPLS